MAAQSTFLTQLTSGQLAPGYSTAPAAPTNTSTAPPATPKGTTNSVYWVGQDGNTYVKGPNGVQNYGKASSTSDAGAETALGSVQATRIQDPNPGGVNPNSTNNGTASSGGGTTYQDRTNDLTLQNAGLSAVDATQKAGLDKVSSALNDIAGKYEGDLGTAKTEYGSTSDSNQNDLQANKEVALQNAAQGRRGLYSTLASLGALSGTGLELANNAVQKGANSDLTTAADTFATNQRALDTNYNTYVTNEQRAEQKAKDAAANDEEQVRNDALKSQQTYLSNIANDYQAEGKPDLAAPYVARAAALFPQIATTNVPTIDLGYTGAAYTAPTLSQYVGKANNTTVQTTPATPNGSLFNIPGLVALNKRQTA